jgi:4a-hydroxytetrahydrobiopterin dehydratase
MIHEVKMVEPLSADRIAAELGSLPGWSYEDNALRKEFKFKRFREAIDFVVRIAAQAEQQKHHPDLRNVYNRVWITLNTHEAGDRVTDRDIALAHAIEEAASGLVTS